MKLCKDCKHWHKFTDAWDVKYHGPEVGTCDSIKFVYRDTEKCQSDGLAYWDYEGYSAGFETGAAFGCIHWESK